MACHRFFCAYWKRNPLDCNNQLGYFCFQLPLPPGHVCRIEIVSDSNEIITPKCEVTWSSLLRTLEKENEALSIYGAGLKFIELTDSEKLFLEKNISEFAK